MARTTDQNIIFDILESPPFWKYSMCWVFSAAWDQTFYDWFSFHVEMLTMRRTSEDRTTQLMDAGGCQSFSVSFLFLYLRKSDSQAGSATKIQATSLLSPFRSHGINIWTDMMSQKWWIRRAVLWSATGWLWRWINVGDDVRQLRWIMTKETSLGEAAGGEEEAIVGAATSHISRWSCSAPDLRTTKIIHG